MLTEIEKEICCRLANGETMKEISASAGVHFNTLTNYVNALKQRFHGADGKACKSTTQLVAVLVDKGLLGE